MAENLPLVGREDELGLLRAAFREIAAEPTEIRLVVVTGVSGIGKTSLCATAAAQFEAEGALVLSGSCPRPWGAPRAYAPFAAAWAIKPPTGRPVRTNPPRGETPPQRPGEKEQRETRPEDDAWDSEREEGFAGWLASMSLLDGDAPEVGRAWLCEQVLGQLQRWAQCRPVVLMVEDAHWIDMGSMGLLQTIATARIRGRLLVVVTARTDAPDSGGPPAHASDGGGPLAHAPDGGGPLAHAPDSEGPPAHAPNSGEPLAGGRDGGRAPADGFDGGVVPALLELATRPGARLLELGPLRPDAVREIVSELDDTTAAEVVGRAAGHPLFAVELLRHRGPGLPSTLRVLLGRRIRELGPDGVRLLAAVTIAGERACEPELAEMLGMATVSGLVEDGIRRGLLTRTDPAPATGLSATAKVEASGLCATAAGAQNGLAISGRLWARHPLLGEVAVAEAVPAEKRRWHAWLGERAEGAAAAWHWERAGEPERAAECWYAGGVAATARHAHAEAAYAYQRALELRETPWLHSALAHALRWSGRPKEAAAVLRRALAVTPPDDLPTRCEILCQLWDCRFVSGAREEAYETLAEATALAAGLPDSPLTARLAAAEASTLMNQGRYAEGVVQSRIAQRHAERVSDRATQANALSLLGVCLAFADANENEAAAVHRADGREADGRGANAACGADGREADGRGANAACGAYGREADGRGANAACGADGGEADGSDADAARRANEGTNIEVAIETLEAARSLAHRLGSVRELTRAASNLTFVLVNTGRYERALTIGREALSRLDSIGLAGALGGPLHFNVAVSLLALGRWDQLHEFAARIDDRLPPAKAARMRLCLAEVAALRGDQAETARLLAEADEIMDGPDELYEAEKAIPLAVARRTAGRPRAAIEVCRVALRARTGALGPIERLRLCSEALGALNELQTARGRVTRIDNPADVIAEFRPTQPPSTLEEQALALLCEAEITRDPKLWAETADAWEGLKMVHPAAYARMRKAEALIAAGDQATAGSPLRQAFSTAVALAAAPLREDTERVARQGRIPLLSDRPEAPDRPHMAVLTRREREVFELVGCGRTNREIAKTLVLSERTVDVHVSRILAKLGAANRSEAIHLASTKP